MTLSAKRRPGEDFEAYKKRRRKENKSLKERLKGTVVWNSSSVIKKPDGGLLDLVKVKMQGTYVKGIGKLKSSFSAKNKFDKLRAKAIKKRLLGEKEDAETKS